MRRLLPAVIVIIVGLGGIRVAMAREHLLNEITGIALLITAILVALVAVLLRFGDGLRGLSLKLAARERALVATAAELEAARDAANSAARVKADFIANMSHEIRTPLTAIVGYADRLGHRTDLDANARREITRIDGAAQALLSIVNDVLDFSKLEAGQVTIRPRPVDPSRLLTDSLRLFEQQAAAKRLTLEYRAEGPLPGCLLIDPDRTRQILLNLIGNAIKFTEKGYVRLAAAYHAESLRLEVSVEDTGPGLEEAQVELLFRRFSQIDAASTRRFGGTGLGLAICKGLVDAMQGQIGVQSTPGHGSVFHFSIPAPLGVWPVESPAATLSTHLRGARVLVVDDDQINRELARDVLTAVGVTVTEAIDGFSGVAAATSGDYDAILMDLRMPGLDGGEAAARIRAAAGPGKAPPILAFSANVELGGVTERPDGFDGRVRKPFVGADLVAAIAACVPARPA